MLAEGVSSLAWRQRSMQCLRFYVREMIVRKKPHKSLEGQESATLS